jgi:hypothetical protein
MHGRWYTYSSQQAERLSFPAFTSPSTDHNTTDRAKCGQRNERQSKRDQERLQTIDADFEERLVED